MSLKRHETEDTKGKSMGEIWRGAMSRQNCGPMAATTGTGTELASAEADTRAHHSRPQPNLGHSICLTTSYSFVLISSQRVEPPPPQSFHFFLVRWPISRDPFLFKVFSNLPCCDTRKRRASLYPNILSPCNSRVATPSGTLMTFCKLKQRTSNKVKGSPRP